MNDFGTKVEKENKKNALAFIKTITQEMIDNTRMSWNNIGPQKHEESDLIVQLSTIYNVNRGGRKYDVIFKALFADGEKEPVDTALVRSMG